MHQLKCRKSKSLANAIAIRYKKKKSSFGKLNQRRFFYWKWFFMLPPSFCSRAWTRDLKLSIESRIIFNGISLTACLIFYQIDAFTRFFRYHSSKHLVSKVIIHWHEFRRIRRTLVRHNNRNVVVVESLQWIVRGMAFRAFLLVDEIGSYKSLAILFHLWDDFGDVEVGIERCTRRQDDFNRLRKLSALFKQNKVFSTNPRPSSIRICLVAF